MAAREETGDCELYCLILAHNNFTNLLCEGVKVIGHSDMICGNDAIRNQGYTQIDWVNLIGKGGVWLAGIDPPLFQGQHEMIFSDATKTLQEIVSEFKAA